MMCCARSIFFDSFSWELNSCEKCKWLRNLHQKFTYNDSKVHHQNILVSYSKGKKSEHCWQTQGSRRGHGNWWYHKLLQATGQTVTDTVSDTWQQICLWWQQELRQVPKCRSLRQQIPVQSSTELNTLAHVQTSHASTPPATGRDMGRCQAKFGKVDGQLSEEILL